MSTKTLHITDESQSVTKTIVLLAWPVFLEQIFTTLVSYADTAMVGSLGAWATASVTISNPPIMLLNGIVMALGVGITSLVARGVGAKDPQTVKKLMHHAIWAIIVIGIPICLITTALHRMIPLWMGAGPDILDAAAQYNLIISFGRFFMVVSMMLNSAFRGYGDTKTPLLVNTVMNIVNVIFNFLLIYPTREISLFGSSFTVYGAGLEVNGAAIASSLGMAIAGLMTLWVAFFRKNEYQIHMKNGWKIDKALTKQIFRNQFSLYVGANFYVIFRRICYQQHCRIGNCQCSRKQLMFNRRISFLYACFCLSNSGNYLGRPITGSKKPTLAEKFVRQTLFMGVVAMAFTGAGLFVFSNQLIGVFTPDADVIALAAHCLRLVAFMQIPQVAAWIFSGVLRGAGDTKFNFYITAATNWGIRTLWSVLAIRVFHFGLFSTQVVMLVEIIVRLFLLYLRYRTGKWKYVLDR